MNGLKKRLNGRLTGVVSVLSAFESATVWGNLWDTPAGIARRHSDLTEMLITLAQTPGSRDTSLHVIKPAKYTWGTLCTLR